MRMMESGSLHSGQEQAVIANLTNVHAACNGEACVIHKPTNHHMRGWNLHWRDDRKIFERICAHGIGHPDPDQIDYWTATGQSWQMVHSCDRCCVKESDDGTLP